MVLRSQIEKRKLDILQTVKEIWNLEKAEVVTTPYGLCSPTETHLYKLENVSNSNHFLFMSSTSNLDKQHKSYSIIASV